MTRRTVLNVSSTKKRDTMLNVTNTDNSGAATSGLTQTQAVVNGGNGGVFLWNGTARNLYLPGSTSINYKSYQAARSATTCYMVGLKERIRLTSNSGVAWIWRRICFTEKGLSFSAIAAGDNTPTGNYELYHEDPNNAGMRRLLFNTAVASLPNTQNRNMDIIFRGTSGVDWDNYITASTDPQRISVKYDKTITFRSGNSSGTIREFTRWMPMKHNLVYDDDENGKAEFGNYFSSFGRSGMGDYYVLDIIQPSTGSAASDLLAFSVNSTLYWHEK